MDNLIKALRCIASNTPEGDCYEEQYNFGRKGQRISCYGSPETMKCPYNQDTYGVCFEDGECSEWLSEAAELLEELRQYRQIGTLEECREARELFTEMYKRKMTIAIIEEYMKFEDERIRHGFSYDSLLKARVRREPMKASVHISDTDVKIGNIIFRKGTRVYKCPCGSLITRSHKFCPDCGQAIDWSGRKDESK